MKKTLIPVITLALVLGAPVAFAQTGDSADQERPMSGVRAAIEKVRGDFRGQIEEKRAEVKDGKDAIEQDRVERRADVRDIRGGGLQIAVQKTAAMLNAMTARLQKLIDRVSSRLAKVKAAGGDTTIAQVNLDAAKADLAKAKTQIAALPTISISSTTASTTAATQIDALRTAVKAVKDTFKAVHTDLEKAVSALNMSAKGTKDATTTPSSTSTSA